MKNKKLSTVLSIILLLVLVGLFFYRDKLLPAPLVPAQSQKISSVLIGGISVNVKVVDTPALQAKGLSGTDSLGDNEGMLFIFNKPDMYAFWMKDMKYPIDIIWLNTEKKVVYIKEKADPSSYPSSFKPSEAALYVLEVPSGFSESHSVNIGDQVSF